MPMDSYLCEPSPDARRPMLLGSWDTPDLEVPKSFKSFKGSTGAEGLSAAELPEPEAPEPAEPLPPLLPEPSDEASPEEAPERRCGAGLRPTLARVVAACIPERGVLRGRARRRAGPVCAVAVGVSGPFLWMTPEDVRLPMLLLAVLLCLLSVFCSCKCCAPRLSAQRGDGSAMAGKLPRMHLELQEGHCLEPEAATCLVCLADFASGDELMVLPCFHRYHTACIDKWLQSHAACPSCRCDVDQLVKGQV